MSNLGLLEYRISRLEKNEEDKQRLMESITEKLNQFMQEEAIRNYRQDSKIRNIMVIGTFIGTTAFNVAIVLFEKFIGG